MLQSRETSESRELPIGNTTALAIDNLKYDYTGNKLIKVTDEQQNPSGYPYMANPGTIGYDNDSSDGNGNMISNPDKGISAIQYNYLNLPQQITPLPHESFRVAGKNKSHCFCSGFYSLF